MKTATAKKQKQQIPADGPTLQLTMDQFRRLQERRQLENALTGRGKGKAPNQELQKDMIPARLVWDHVEPPGRAEWRAE